MAVLLTYGFRCGGTSYSVAVLLMQQIICYFYILLEIEFILDELFYIKTKYHLLMYLDSTFLYPYSFIYK